MSLDYEAIRNLWDEGVRGPTNVARRLGYNSASVWRALVLMGIDTSGRKHCSPPPHVIEILKSHHQINKDTAIQRLLNCNAYKKENAKARHRLIIQDLQDGMSQKAVAFKYGIARSTVLSAQNRTGYMKQKREARDKVIKNVIKEYSAGGITVAALGEKYGYSESWVWRILSAKDISRALSSDYERREDFKRKSTVINIDSIHAETIASIVSLYEQGDSIAQVSKKVGYYYDIIKKVLRKHNVQLRPSCWRTKCDDESIIKLWRDGYGPTAVAKMVGRNPTTIHRVLKRNGIINGQETRTVESAS